MNDEIRAIINDFERDKKIWHPNEKPWTVDVATGVFDMMMYKASVDLSPEEYELFLRHIFGTKPPNVL